MAEQGWRTRPSFAVQIYRMLGGSFLECSRHVIGGGMREEWARALAVESGSLQNQRTRGTRATTWA